MDGHVAGQSDPHVPVLDLKPREDGDASPAKDGTRRTPCSPKAHRGLLLRGGRGGWILGLLIAAARRTSAHDHWIRFIPGDSEARIEIGSGHSFPNSELQLSQRLLTDVVVTDPQGHVSPLRLEARDKVWTASLGPLTPGVWSASFTLKKPQEDEALFQGRALLVVGDADDQTRYATGRGLEIVPISSIKDLKPGGSLTLAIHVDGTPVAGSICVTPERGPGGFFSTGKDRPAILPLKDAGAYLLTTTYKGKTFALVLTVPTVSEGSP